MNTNIERRRHHSPPNLTPLVPVRPPPTSWRLRPIAALSAAIGLLGAGIALRGARRVESPAPRSCQTAIVTRGALDGILRLPGTLQATQSARIGAAQPGRVVAVNVSPGERVLAGQVLARLDDTDERATANGAEAQVAAALSLDLRARRELRRALDLLRARGVLPDDAARDQLLDGAAGDAQLELIHANAQVGRQAAALKLARSILTKRTIRAPMDGVVLARSIEPGESITASPPGPPLFVIGSDPRQLKMSVEVDERYIDSVGPDTVRFTAAARGRDELSATVREVLPSVGAKASPARYAVILSVPNEDGKLHPGMTATVEIPVKSPSDALAVPQSAIGFDSPSGFVELRSGMQPTAEAPFVWFSTSDGQSVRRAVEIGVLDADLVEIRAFGLQPGLVVVTDLSPTACRVRPPLSPYGAGGP